MEAPKTQVPVPRHQATSELVTGRDLAQFSSPELLFKNPVLFLQPLGSSYFYKILSEVGVIT